MKGVSCKLQPAFTVICTRYRIHVYSNRLDVGLNHVEFPVRYTYKFYMFINYCARFTGKVVKSYFFSCYFTFLLMLLAVVIRSSVGKIIPTVLSYYQPRRYTACMYNVPV